MWTVVIAGAGHWVAEQRATRQHDTGGPDEYAGVTSAEPGSFDGLLLAVDDIDVARDDLRSRGVEVSEVFHEAGGGPVGGFHVGTEQRASGPDPERRSYASYASFNDPEGNRYVLQEITERLPGRV